MGTQEVAAAQVRLHPGRLTDGAMPEHHHRRLARAYTTEPERTGAKTKTTVGTLTMFDAKGGVLWQAPR